MKKYLLHLSNVEAHVKGALRGGSMEGVKEKVEAASKKLFKGKTSVTDAGTVGGILFCQTDAGGIFVSSTAFIASPDTLRDLTKYLRLLPTLGVRFRFRSGDAELCMKKITGNAVKQHEGEEMLVGFVAFSKGFLCSVTYWGEPVDARGDDALPVDKIADYFEETPIKEDGKTVGGKIIFTLESR
jgi:hypothetical protein